MTEKMNVEAILNKWRQGFVWNALFIQIQGASK